MPESLLTILQGVGIVLAITGALLLVIWISCTLADRRERIEELEERREELKERLKAKAEEAEMFGQRLADMFALHPDVAKKLEAESLYGKVLRVKSIDTTVDLDLIGRLGEAKRARNEAVAESELLTNYYRGREGFKK